MYGLDFFQIPTKTVQNGKFDNSPNPADGMNRAHIYDGCE